MKKGNQMSLKIRLYKDYITFGDDKKNFVISSRQVPRLEAFLWNYHDDNMNHNVISVDNNYLCMTETTLNINNHFDIVLDHDMVHKMIKGLCDYMEFGIMKTIEL